MREIIIRLIKSNVPIQSVWVLVSSIDWDAKTMDCKGISDDLAYYDVLLGIGSEYKKPKKDTKCLIGIIDNKEAAPFLIIAEEIEEYLLEDSKGFKIHLKDGKLTLNGDGFGSLIKIEDLVSKINRLESKLDGFITKYNTHTHITTATSVTIPAPVVGVISPTVSTETPLGTQTTVAELENDKIKHGNG